MIGLTHKILKLKTEFTVRKSVLHKVRNYLIALPDQPDLGKALVLWESSTAMVRWCAAFLITWWLAIAAD